MAIHLLAERGRVDLEAPVDVVDKVAYVIANPTAAGLVATPAEWPGLITLPESLGRDARVVQRPDYFFRREGPDGDAGPSDRGPGDRRPRNSTKNPLPGAEIGRAHV
mgnify:CR=1 FL=1